MNTVPHYKDSVTGKLVAGTSTGGFVNVADPMLSFIQYSGSGYSYYCEAAIGSARSASVWRVLRKTDATGDLVYAGTGALDQAADDLATVALLTYTLGA